MNTARDIAAERLHVRNFCLPAKKVLNLLYLLKYLDYKDEMVFVGFVGISALIWYAARYCEQSGSDSTGQNVK